MANSYSPKPGLKQQRPNKFQMGAILPMTGHKAMVISFGNQGITATELMELWGNFAWLFPIKIW